MAGSLLLAPPAMAATAPFAPNENPMPLPPSEQNLPTVTAKPVLQVGPPSQTLEGALFAPNGDLLFCNVTERKVMRLSPDGKLADVLHVPEFGPGGLAWHPDGRLFVAGIDPNTKTGGIKAMAADGSTEWIIKPEAGYMPNDLAFAKNGGFYFSDFHGSSTVPSGGIYYTAPDFTTIAPLIPHMGQANGVAVSPDGKTLWATEYARNLLHRATLVTPTQLPLTGTKTPYHFTGVAPDSMRVDDQGNVYVAVVGQGRVMIFNKAGLPIGQVLIPGREKGLNLGSTSLALHPHKKEMRIVTGTTSDAPGQIPMIFAAPAFDHAPQ